MNITFHFCQVCSARCLYEFHAAHLNPRWIRMTPIMDVSPVFPRLVQLVGLNGWKMLRAVVISKSATLNSNWAFFSNDAKKITVTKNRNIAKSEEATSWFTCCHCGCMLHQTPPVNSVQLSLYFFIEYAFFLQLSLCQHHQPPLEAKYSYLFRHT